MNANKSGSRIEKSGKPLRKSSREEKGFTPVVAVLSLIALSLTVVLVIRGAFELGPPLDTDTVPSTAGLLFVLPVFVIVLLYRKFTGKLLLTQGQLLTMYCIVTLGAVIIGLGSFYLILSPIMVLSSLATNIDPLYSDVGASFAPILDSLPSFLVLRGEEATTSFLLGQASVPWGSWIMPIILWTLYWTAVFLVFLCITAVVQRQWSLAERYSYPVIQAPVSLLSFKKTKTSSNGPLWLNRMMWAGALIPICVFFWNDIVSKYIFTGMAIPLSLNFAREGYEGFALGFFSTWPYFQIVINFMVIGLGYFVATDILLTYWVTHLVVLCTGRGLTHALGIVGTVGGHSDIMWMFDQMGIGAIVLGILTLYAARGQIRKVWNVFRGIQRGEEVGEQTEPMPYRWAVWGILGGLLFLFLFNMLFLKVTFLNTFIIMASIITTCIAFSRARAEVGVPFSHVNSDLFTVTFTVSIPGKLVGRSMIQAMGFNHALGSGTFGSTMALATESYKISEETESSKFGMTKALLFAVPVALILGFVISLPYFYSLGHNMTRWDIQNITRSGFMMPHWIMFPATHPEGTPFAHWHPDKPYAQAIIAVFMIFLWYMRTMFTWWPFHPIGYVYGIHIASVGYWSSFFLAWLIKVLLVRYMGAEGLRKARPFFLGLIIGYAGWSVLRYAMSLIGLL